MTLEEDRADLQRVLAGDAQAFEGLVRRWQGPLVNLAWRFCHDRSVAEEWTQDAFVLVFRRVRTFKGDAPFSTWLFAVATNLYRSKMRRFVPAGVALEAVRGLADPRGGAEELEAEDVASAVRRAVSYLPARYRDAIVLFYFHEMDLDAAARSLGVPPGTLKARLGRGRDLLRRKLGRTLFARPLESEA